MAKVSLSSLIWVLGVSIQGVAGSDPGLKIPSGINPSGRSHPQVILRVGCRGGRVVVNVSSDILITRMAVTILDEEGSRVETGPGVQVESSRWEYRPSTEGKKILVEVWDGSDRAMRIEGNAQDT